jgi:hypothetical protein
VTPGYIIRAVLQDRALQGVGSVDAARFFCNRPQFLSSRTLMLTKEIADKKLQKKRRIAVNCSSAGKITFYHQTERRSQ